MAQTKYIISLVDRVSRTAATMQGRLAKVTTGAKRASAAIDNIGLLAGGAAIAGIFKLGAELESTRIKFNTLTGSVEAGTKLFEELTEFANATPFSNQALNKNASTLLAFGETAESVTGTLKMLGDISAGDQNKLQSLTLAFAQMKSAGRLMGQDLLQMINVGFNPLQIISEQTGQSMASLKKQMEKGAISSELVTKAFQSATAKGGRFHGLTDKMSRSMAGKWSTVMGKAKFLIAEIGLSFKDQFVPALDGAINVINRMSKWIKDNEELFAKWVKLIGTFVTVLGVAIIAIKLFNLVLSINPISLIIIAIAALIAVIIHLWNESETFRGIILGVWEVLKGMWNTITGFIGTLTQFDYSWQNIGDTIEGAVTKRIEKLLKVMSLAGDAFTLFFAGDYRKAADSAAAAIAGLTGIDDLFKLGQKAGKLFQTGFAKGKDASAIANPLGTLGGGGGSAIPSIGLSAEAQKLQAKGVVSGGIKTFNINIQQVTGIETLSTTNIEESAEKAGNAVVLALTKAFADVNID